MAESRLQGVVRTELSRDLGFYSALAIGVGTMIAAGIFTLSGLAIRNVGSSAVISFLIAAAISSLTALTYCEFTSIYPRSGEGYLYARKTFSPILAYFVGWSLFLGYTSSCAFYISSLSSYFVEFVYNTPFRSVAGLLALAGLTLLNIKGTKESGGFQVLVTAAKVILLIWFIAGGLKFIDVDSFIEKLNTDIVQIAGTSTLVFITFFGFSAIAASAGEVKNPVKNIPRAIFWSVILVTILYTFVVIVTLAAELNEYTEAAMGSAAVKFLGSFGGLVIVAGAIFSMISASNASIMAGSRVTLAMSQLGHLPHELGIVNRRTKTPIVSLMIVSGVIAFFVVALPLEELAHFADMVLLLALIFVNVALIVHRRKFPGIRRPFRVPFVPILPGIAILANLYLLLHIFQQIVPLLVGTGMLSLGIVGFLAWKGTQREDLAVPGEPSKLALGSFVTDQKDKREHILVPLANPNNVPVLIKIASAIAREKNGVLVLLRVGLFPEQMPLEYQSKYIDAEKWILEMGQKEAEKWGAPANALLKVGHNAARAILETARERHCQLIILGWKGYSSSSDKILGRVIDSVVTHARCDIMLVRMKDSMEFQQVLLPTAGGEHARIAEKYAASLVRHFKGNLTLCRVGDPKNKDNDTERKISEKLNNAANRIRSFNGIDAQTKLIWEDSIPEGILKSSSGFDTLMIGATRDSIYQQILFGSIPEQIASTTDKNIIVIKHYNPVKALYGRVMTE